MSRKAKNRQVIEDTQIAEALRIGKNDVKAGRVKSHAEVEKLFQTWISK
jgi:predicted transcriptional regulator